MRLDLKIEKLADVRAAIAALGKDAPKARTLWVNWLGITAQAETRAQLPAKFNQRGTRDAFADAVRFKSSSPSRGEGVLSVGSQTATSRAAAFGQILARHEEGGQRTADAAKGFYVPAKGLRSATTNPPRSLYPKALLKIIEGSRQGVIKGSKRKGTGVTYFATPKGIFRRRQSSFGSAQAEPLWFFVRTIRTAPRTHLFATVDKVMETKAIALGMQAIEETIFRGTL